MVTTAGPSAADLCMLTDTQPLIPAAPPPTVVHAWESRQAARRGAEAMVLGMGIDLCAVARLRQELAAPERGFLRAVFTTAEIAHGESRPHPAEHFAARFAAKEATLKALAGGGASGSFWLDIEVADAEDGAPRLVLHGRAREVAEKLGVVRWHVSLSHERQFATAIVIAEGPP